jgi:hypothetical protein
METNRLSSAKWVSRRTLDSQAHNRDQSTGVQQARGQTPHGNLSNANTNNNSGSMDRRKYGAEESAMGPPGNVRGGNGNAGGGGNYRTNSGNRFGASGSGSSASGTWGSITSNSGSGNLNKMNHHGTGYPSNSLNAHLPHNPVNANHHHHHGSSSGGGNNGSNGGRRGYGEPVEATMPPPPRSVQMGQGTLPAHTTSRDFIPQPRHAKVGSSVASTVPKFMDNSASSPAPDAAATRRWASTTPTPTPRSAHSNPTVTPGAPTAVVAASAHHDPRAGVPRSSPSSPFTTASTADVHGTPVPPLPPATPPNVAAFGGAGPFGPLRASGNSGRPGHAITTNSNPNTNTNHNGNVLSAGVAPPLPPPPPSVAAAPVLSPCSTAPAPRSFTSDGGVTTIAKPALLRSPLEALHLSEHLIFDARDFDEPMAIQPSEIEALLGQVERSAAAAAANTPKEASMGGSLRERRSVTDWGIEEAIKSVLPGMDEDDNSDDAQGPNVLSGGAAAISGSWHTTGEPDTRQPVGVGLLADFPTSFAASFAEPTSTFLGSPFTTADPAANTMDSLSRAFSTAARVDSSSFTTSPAATANATPLQRPPNSPGMHLPQYTIPEELVTMPPSTMVTAALPPAAPSTVAPAATITTTTTTALPASLQKEPSLAKEEVTNGGVVNTSDLITIYPQPSLVGGMSPWLALGTGDNNAATAAVVTAASRASDVTTDLAASKVSCGSVGERAMEKSADVRAPHSVASSRPSLLQSLQIKNGSIDSSFGLTASISANSPAGPPTRQSTVATSAPNTPSLRKETSTPLSTTRSQAYASGGSTRPQRPSLTAPVVNRHTITHIFRETPQSLQQKEAMMRNHENSPDALCRDARWPPRNVTEVEELLRAQGAVKLLRHLTIISFSRKNVTGVQELFDTWARNGIPAPDMGFGAYYYYVKEKSDKLLCMKHNGRGPSPGHGYGRCDFESRRPYSTCRYEHVCLFCRSKEHGWFEEGRCEGYQLLLQEMVRLGVVEEDVVVLLNAMEKDSTQRTVR